MNGSRREFLRAASGLASLAGHAASLNPQLAISLAGMASLASQSAHAQNAEYRAIVCLYMHGGNDSHNWIVPLDPDGYAEYSRCRGALAHSFNNLTKIDTASSQGSGRQFGMPKELASVRKLYEQGNAAIIGNVGTLVQPLTRTEYAAGVGVPARLFSHNDQASTWQSLWPEGARSGWGGRMGDILMAGNTNPAFTSISLAGNAVFLSGSRVAQYNVGVDGPIPAHAALAKEWVMGSDAVGSSLRRIMASGGSNILQSEYVASMQRSMQAHELLKSQLDGAQAPAIPSVNVTIGNQAVKLQQDPLAQQLRMVARLISLNKGLGMSRQVFMVSLNGFDTHNNQMVEHAALTARVAQSIAYFHDAMVHLGLGNQVTLFTASDFGRTLVCNGDGSDHGWGSHHLVVGGAVSGGDIYGRFPVTALGSPDDIGSGRLLPSTSVSQYAATMGEWLGLSSSQLSTVLPGLSAFSRRTLGFLS